MSVDKLVDSTQLDADLTSVANAIRTKGGTSASLAFPADFVSAIAAIPSGGGFDANAWSDLSFTPTRMVLTANITRSFAFAGNPFTVIFWDYVRTGNLGAASSVFRNSPNLQVFVNTSFTGSILSTSSSFLESCPSLGVLDWAGNNIGATMLNGCTSCNLLILRRTSSPLALTNSTTAIAPPFRNGGAGGTVYIPKVLYDHLGDGSSLDYKAATHWSTLDGYGTITWAPIEGSIYETQYADGTPIA